MKVKDNNFTFIIMNNENVEKFSHYDEIVAAACITMLCAMRTICLFIIQFSKLQLVC